MASCPSGSPSRPPPSHCSLGPYGATVQLWNLDHPGLPGACTLAPVPCLGALPSPTDLEPVVSPGLSNTRTLLLGLPIRASELDKQPEKPESSWATTFPSCDPIFFLKKFTFLCTPVPTPSFCGANRVFNSTYHPEEHSRSSWAKEGPTSFHQPVFLATSFLLKIK